MFAVIAIMHIQHDKGGTFEAAFEQLAQNVRAKEPDCLLFQLTRSQSEPRLYKIMELYKDRSSFDRHLKTKHFESLYPNMKACYSDRPEVDYLDAF